MFGTGLGGLAGPSFGKPGVFGPAAAGLRAMAGFFEVAEFRFEACLVPSSCLEEPARAWATLALRRGQVLARMRRASAAVRPLFLYEQRALTAVLASLLIEQSPRIGALRRLTLTQKDAHHGVRNLLF